MQHQKKFDIECTNEIKRNKKDTSDNILNNFAFKIIMRKKILQMRIKSKQRYINSTVYLRSFSKFASWNGTEEDICTKCVRVCICVFRKENFYSYFSHKIHFISVLNKMTNETNRRHTHTHTNKKQTKKEKKKKQQGKRNIIFYMTLFVFSFSLFYTSTKKKLHVVSFCHLK